ncbi:MAG: hypothetical protein ACLS37_10800 [Alistipes sp.]
MLKTRREIEQENTFAPMAKPPRYTDITMDLLRAANQVAAGSSTSPASTTGTRYKPVLIRSEHPVRPQQWLMPGC